ncbi:hypothetical protein FJT64_025310 [Amphibalanus amphitrite]|uniref:Uncharacterized protein n=1 Tax=Amphibalanus amphitrite TaxID=1232801 RepID=A0A6A4W985_AMPAM|nr:hypothetical protein FJT64_025310 [Amphibalanus amphitrite]
MELAPEEMDSLRREMNSLREKMNGLEGEMDDLQQDMTKVREEKAELHLEVARLRRALVEERTARQVAVKELRQEVRRRSAPADRSQGDGEEELAPLKDDTCDKCDVIISCDVTKPSAEEARPAGGSLRPAAPREANIYHLDTELLKMVLSKMDCREMFRARRAATCHALEKADLCGFKLRVSVLRRLARANASSLRELTLPAGVSDWQLEALLEPLKALEQLDVSPPVNSTGKWLRLLPKSLKRLDITESPSVTTEATARLFTALTSLKDVPLHGAGLISETPLAALHGCSQLDTLEIVDSRPVTDIPALTQSELAAVSRMAVTCRKLRTLFIKSSTENCKAVLTALHETDLGWDCGRYRTMNLYVPNSVFDQLTKPPNGSKIYLKYFNN